MYTRQIALSTMLLVFLFAAAGYAAPINLVGGTAGTIPGGAINDFIMPGFFPGPQMGGYYGSQIEIDVPGESTLVIDYFGAEAGFVNAFSFMLAVLFSHPGGMVVAPSLASPLDTFSTTVSGTAILPFSFSANSGAATVSNGSNPDDSVGLVMGPNFFASCDPFGTTAGSGGTSCSSVYLFLDDGGAESDDNHDDMLVRLTVTAVTDIPEPGTWLLLGAGLMGLGGLRRRSV
jgi:hypothetical protein